MNAFENKAHCICNLIFSRYMSAITEELTYTNALRESGNNIGSSWRLLLVVILLGTNL